MRIALLEKLGFDALGIDIEANASSRTVALTGEVSDRASRELAPEIARSVEGVESVRSDIEVAVPDDGARRPESGETEREVGDALLEARAKTALIGEIGTNAFSVELESADGVVTVRGELPSGDLRDAAIATLEEVDGVTEVVDLVELG